MVVPDVWVSKALFELPGPFDKAGNPACQWTWNIPDKIREHVKSQFLVVEPLRGG